MAGQQDGTTSQSNQSFFRKVQDTNTGREIRRFACREEAQQICFSADGKKLYVSGLTRRNVSELWVTFWVFSVADGKQLERRQAVDSAVSGSFAVLGKFSPYGPYFVGLSEPHKAVLLYDVDKDKLHTMPALRNETFGAVDPLAIYMASGDGKSVCGAAPNQGHITSTEGGRVLKTFKWLDYGINAAAITRNGDRVAVHLTGFEKKDNKLCVFEATTGALSHEVPTFNGELGSGSSFAISRNATHVLASGKQGEVVLIRLADKKANCAWRSSSQKSTSASFFAAAVTRCSTKGDSS